MPTDVLNMCSFKHLSSHFIFRSFICLSIEITHIFWKEHKKMVLLFLVYLWCVLTVAFQFNFYCFNTGTHRRVWCIITSCEPYVIDRHRGIKTYKRNLMHFVLECRMGTYYHIWMDTATNNDEHERTWRGLVTSFFDCPYRTLFLMAWHSKWMMDRRTTWENNFELCVCMCLRAFSN